VIENLYSALNDYYKFTPEALEDLANLSHAIKTNHKSVARQLDELIKEQAERHNLCSECFTELTFTTDNENSEYFGFPASETFKKGHCENCGWNDND
jgi:uncharacterized protein with PIN domain